MNKLIYQVLGLLLLTLAVHAAPADSANGKRIFTSRCTSCHSVDKVVVGPALKNVYDRRRESWIIAFVHGSQNVINSGDTTAKSLFLKFNKTVMPNHADLTDENIREIISYIKAETERLAAIPHVATANNDDNPPVYAPGGALHRLIFADEPGSHLPMSINDYGIWTIIFSFIVLVVVILLVVVRLNTLVADYRLKYTSNKSRPSE